MCTTHPPTLLPLSLAITRPSKLGPPPPGLAKLADEVARVDLVPIILEGRASSRDIYNESSAQLRATVDAAHAGSHKSGARAFHTVPLDPAAQLMSLSN